MVDGSKFAFNRVAFLVIAFAAHCTSQAAGPLPWDYDPYHVKVWIVADQPEVIDFPALIKGLEESFYKSPGAAWDPVVERPPSIVRSVIRRSFDSLQFDMLTANDYVLAMTRNHEFASSVRSIATAGDKLSRILGNETSIAALKQAGQTIPNANWQAFLDSVHFEEHETDVDGDGTKDVVDRLHIAGGLQDGSEAMIYFSQLFTARLKNAIAENEDWESISDQLSIDGDGRLMLTEPDQEPREIPIDVLLQPIRVAVDQNQSWEDFKTQWSLDEDETLYLKIPGTTFDLPLPDRVFKDFYLKGYSANGVKKPDGAVGLDNREAFVNQQVLIDQVRNLLITGDGWKAFASHLEVAPEGTLFLEQQWVAQAADDDDANAKKKANDTYGTLILPRGIAMNLQPEAKIIDPKIPGSLFSVVDQPDKIFIVKIESRTQPFQVSVRELDCPMRMMGPITHAQATSNVDLADAVARATLRAFSPIIRLENVGKKSAVGRVRAGGLIVKQAKSIGVAVSNPPTPEDEESAKAEKDAAKPKPDAKKAAPEGALVDRLMDPDAKSMLKPGDLIVSLSGKPVTNVNDLIDLLDRTVVGWTVEVEVLRSGKKIAVKAPVSKGDYIRDRHSPAAINEGDFLQPVIRRINSYGNPIMLEIVDFAALRLDKLDGAVANMYAWAGRVGTLQGRSDRRTTRTAMKVRPYYDDTIVRMHAQNEPDVPLIGYDVYEKNLDTGKMKLVGRSDWDGRIWIEKTESPMRLLYVKNGRSVLARLPVIPGEHPMEIADIPGDDLRLRAEAYLKGVENAIVDLVAIRTLLAARIRLKLEKKDLKGARELLDALRAQPTYDVISKEMDQKSTIIKSDNRFKQTPIDNMFARTRKMLVEHVSDRLTFDLEKDVAAVEAGNPMPSKVAAEAAEEQAAAPPVSPAPSKS